MRFKWTKNIGDFLLSPADSFRNVPSVATQRVLLPILLTGCFVFASPSVQATETERRVEQPVRQSIETRQAAQKEAEQWRTDKERLMSDFEQLQLEVKELHASRESLNKSTFSIENRLNSKKRQLTEIARITGEIEPFLDQLFDQLQQITGDGLPFLRDERQQRIDKLQTVISDPAVTVGERYRRLMEALLVEAEYGFTTEVYQEHITLGGDSTLVDIFRMGRLSLFYLTLDQKSCGFYNKLDKAWQPLAKTHLRSIKTAVAIAAKLQPVELLSLPLGRMASR